MRIKKFNYLVIAVRFAERERSRALTARALRHKNLTTSARYYLHQTRLDHAKRVSIALKWEAHLLVLGLKNPLAAGVSEETLKRARAAGAITPHGLCSSAMQGKACGRASNCLECPFLLVLASRRPRLEADRDAYLEISKRLEAEGDSRAAENALCRAKLCEAHLIKIKNLEERR